jgi:hypothetical protein
MHVPPMITVPSPLPSAPSPPRLPDPTPPCLTLPSASARASARPPARPLLHLADVQGWPCLHHFIFLTDSPRKVILERVEAEAVARAQAEQLEESEAAALARDQKRQEMAEKKSPMDVARAEITRMSNGLTAKLRSLQACLVNIQHLPSATVEEKSDVELYLAKHKHIQKNLVLCKTQLDAALALQDRATQPLLDKTIKENKTRCLVIVNTLVGISDLSQTFDFWYQQIQPNKSKKQKATTAIQHIQSITNICIHMSRCLFMLFV